MRSEASQDPLPSSFLFGALWVVITVAVITAGLTSLVFFPDSTWKGETNVLVFGFSLVTAGAGLFLEARHDFAAFCFGAFWYAIIVAVISGAVAILGEDSHPVALAVAVVTGAFALFAGSYGIWARKGKPHVIAAYDKATWHFDATVQYSLPREQAYVHGGMFLAWALDSGFASEFLQEETQEAVSEIRTRKRTGPKVFEAWDGVLTGDLFNETGNAFARWYFGNTSSSYTADFEEVLCAALPSSFHVEDTWENFDLLRARIDQRFGEWQAKKGETVDLLRRRGRAR